MNNQSFLNFFIFCVIVFLCLLLSSQLQPIRLDIIILAQANQGGAGYSGASISNNSLGCGGGNAVGLDNLTDLKKNKKQVDVGAYGGGAGSSATNPPSIGVVDGNDKLNNRTMVEKESNQTKSELLGEFKTFRGYDSPSLNFSISHPADWQVNEYSDHIDLLAPKDNSSNSFQTNISVYNFGPSQINDERELALYADNLIEDLKKNYSHFQLISSRNDSFKGFPAFKIVYESLDSKMSPPIQKNETLVLEGKDHYLYGITVSSNKPFAYMQTLHKILDSLQVESKYSSKISKLVLPRSEYNVGSADRVVADDYNSINSKKKVSSASETRFKHPAEFGTAAANMAGVGSINFLSPAQVFELVGDSVVSVSAINTTSKEEHFGSGFVYDCFGNIVTNHHVIVGVDKIFVTFLDGNSYPAIKVRTDQYADLGVLRINSSAILLQKTRPLTFDNSSNVKIGEEVVAIGNPLGELGGTVTKGVISQINRPITEASPFQIPDSIQTDAAINDGNSGGPLLNLEGKVVGINSAGLGGGAEIGLNFALPSNLAKKIVPELIQNKSYRHPWVGLQAESLTPLTKFKEGLPQDLNGVIIRKVYDQTPVAKAGLFVDDIVVKVDGNIIRNVEDLTTYINQKSVGEIIKLEVLRQGKLLVMSVSPIERPQVITYE